MILSKTTALTLKSTSSSLKRKRRIERAVKYQTEQVNLAQVMHMMDTQDFRDFYENEYKAYLDGREDVYSTGDSHTADNAFLDCILKLKSLADITSPDALVSLEDRVEEEGEVVYKKAGEHRNPA